MFFHHGWNPPIEIFNPLAALYLLRFKDSSLAAFSFSVCNLIHSIRASFASCSAWSCWCNPVEIPKNDAKGASYFSIKYLALLVNFEASNFVPYCLGGISDSGLNSGTWAIFASIYFATFSVSVVFR